MDGLMMDFPLTLQHVLDRAARLYPRKRIVSKTPEGMHRYTYADMHRRVKRLGNALRALGIGDGDRVATFALNGYRHLELYFAVPCIGAVLHTLNVRLFPEQLHFIVNDAEDRLIFVDGALVPLLEKHQEHLPTVRGYVIMGGDAGATTLSPAYDYETLLAEADEHLELPELREEQAAAMCYTSGTTGDPKGVLYSHRSLFLHTLGLNLADSLATSESDTVLIVVPQFHANAWGLPYACALTGANQVFPGPFMQPEHLASLIQDERVTIAAGVPTLWIGLYHHLKAHAHDLSCLRYTVVGGSAMPRALLQAFEEDLGIPVLHAWGMTETAPLGTVSRVRSHMADWPADRRYDVQAKQGAPVPCVEMRIADEAGEELPWDGTTVGEVQVRGPWVANQYFGVPRSRESFTEDGWFRTGDVATMDQDGFMEITDRTKDLIKSGGEWISSVELENVIMSHPKIRECAVIAVPHEKWQERPLAVAVPTEDARDDVTGPEIIEFLDGKVADWWKPENVVFVDELPKTSVGKFNKRALRERFAK